MDLVIAFPLMFVSTALSAYELPSHWAQAFSNVKLQLRRQRGQGTDIHRICFEHRSGRVCSYSGVRRSDDRSNVVSVQDCGEVGDQQHLATPRLAAGVVDAFRPSQSQKALGVTVRDPLSVGGAHRELIEESACLHHRAIGIVG